MDLQRGLKAVRPLSNSSSRGEKKACGHELGSQQSSGCCGICFQGPHFRTDILMNPAAGNAGG